MDLPRLDDPKYGTYNRQLRNASQLEFGCVLLCCFYARKSAASGKGFLAGFRQGCLRFSSWDHRSCARWRGHVQASHRLWESVFFGFSLAFGRSFGVGIFYGGFTYIEIMSVPNAPSGGNLNPRFAL